MKNNVIGIIGTGLTGNPMAKHLLAAGHTVNSHNRNTLLQSISKVAAECWSLRILAPKIVKGDYSPGFTVDNFVKDPGISLEEAEAMKLSLPGLALIKQLYLSVQATGNGSSGNQALYLALEKLSNMDKK